MDYITNNDNVINVKTLKVWTLEQFKDDMNQPIDDYKDVRINLNDCSDEWFNNLEKSDLIEIIKLYIQHNKVDKANLKFALEIMKMNKKESK